MYKRQYQDQAEDTKQELLKFENLTKLYLQSHHDTRIVETMKWKMSRHKHLLNVLYHVLNEMFLHMDLCRLIINKPS